MDVGASGDEMGDTRGTSAWRFLTTWGLVFVSVGMQRSKVKPKESPLPWVMAFKMWSMAAMGAIILA